MSSWPQSDILSKCFILVRWLHAQGVAWSGSSSELASQLAEACDGAPWFRNADELLKFMESNADMLRDLGFEAVVRKPLGRPASIELHINTRGSGAPQQTPADLPRQLAGSGSLIDETLSTQVAEPASIASASKRSVVAESGTRLYELTGVSLEYVPPIASANVDVVQEARRNPQAIAPSRKQLFVMIGAAVVLVLATWIFASARHAETPGKPTVVTKAETTPQPPTPAPIAAPEERKSEEPKPVEPKPIEPKPIEPKPEATDPVESEKTSALLDQASSTKLPAPQYELAMRYVQGLGVQRDYGSAYAWLTLAKANGSLEADSAIQNLGNLSADDLQRAHVEIGKAFSAGVNVRRDYLLAYKSLLLAERSGSSEAATLKKELAAKMPAWQIEQAGGPKQKQINDKDR